MSGTPRLRTVQAGPETDATGSVVWLHGLGASGHDFEPIVPYLQLPRVRFVFPDAPARPVTINMGLIMPAWYDVVALGRAEGGEHAPHVRDSAALVEELLAREKERGVPAGRIVLAGFSQGAAMALHVGLRHAETLAGIVVLSGYEVLAGTREAEASASNAGTPILFGHGTLDPLVPVERGRAAYDAVAQGRDARWHEYPMGHEVCDEEIVAVRDWLKERLP